MGLYVPPLLLDVPEQTYSGTIAWTGTTAPSGTATNTYRWTRAGGMVIFHFSIKYSVAGAALTQVVFDLSADMPAPYVPNGFSGASAQLYNITGRALTSASAGATANGFLRRNSGDTGFEFLAAFASSSVIRVAIDGFYFAS